MNLLEYENQRFDDLWNDETINGLKKNEPARKETEMFPDVDRTDEHWEMKQDEYHLWQGKRLPQWM